VKRKRPHIPIPVRLTVIARQLQESRQLYDVLTVAVLTMSEAAKLDHLLTCKFGEEKYHLDHDPSLVLRSYDEATGQYTPDANDPDFLVYRTEEDHRLKTYVRGEGAQFSDAAKRRRAIKQQRQERPRPNRWPPKGSRPMRRSP